MIALLEGDSNGTPLWLRSTTILNDEKRRLDNLKGIGALIGTPSVAFLESANSVNQTQKQAVVIPNSFRVLAFCWS